MALLEAMTAAVMAALVVMFIGVLVGYTRSPIPQRRDAAVFFGVVAAFVLTWSFSDVPGVPALPLRQAAAALFLAQPWLLVRMLRHFRQVPRAVEWAGIAFFLAGAGLLSYYRVDEVPPTAFMATVLGFFILEGYAAWAFFEGARRARGGRRQRMQFAFVATLSLPAAVTLFAAGSLLPEPLLPLDTVIAFLGVMVVVGYALGFATPNWLRRSWQALELRRFLDRVRERLPDVDRRIMARLLADTANELVETERSQVVLPTRTGRERHTTTGVTPAPSLRYPGSVVAAVLEAKGPHLVLTGDMGPDERAFCQPGDRALILVPLDIGDDERGLLAVPLAHPSLFPEEDMDTLELLGHQAGVEIRNLTVLEAQRAALEQAKELERFKSDFLRAVAHELANPLSPIQIHLHLLEAKGVPDRLADAFSVIRRNVDRIDRLVDTMADVSRLREARIDIERQDMRLDKLVGDAAATYEKQAAQADCPLHVELDGALPIKGDPQRLGQVMDNLLSNAIKYSPDGGAIDVRTRREGNDAIVEVRDRGLGLTQRQRRQLFQVYQRLHRDAAPDVPGTGLGLYVTKSLVELHGGELECESPGPDQGTTFRVRIPLEQERPHVF